jgi:hypothetical protein
VKYTPGTIFAAAVALIIGAVIGSLIVNLFLR